VTTAELCKRLTAAFRQAPQCAAVAVMDVYRLDRPDVSGCNWSFTLVLEPNGTPADAYGLAYAQVIPIARRAWNLAPQEV
jgi:hypothetical protein